MKEWMKKWRNESETEGIKEWTKERPKEYTRLKEKNTVNRFMWISAIFGTCTVVSVNGTHVEDKNRWFKSECAHFSCDKCAIYTLDGASAKFSSNSQETDNSEGLNERIKNITSCVAFTT
jgi:hypothetical protein